MKVRWNHWFTLMVLSGGLVIYGVVKELKGHSDDSLIVAMLGIWLSLLFGFLALASALDTKKEHNLMLEQHGRMLGQQDKMLAQQGKMLEQQIKILAQQDKMLERQDKTIEQQNKIIGLLEEIRELLKR